MRTQVLVLLGAAAAGLTQDINATVVTWNPPDACYIARLEGAINVRARASSDVFGLGFNFHVSLDGLPEDQDPFGVDYYLNENPVPEDGNCTETEGHLDPFGRTDDPPCDDDEAQSFHDPYTSLAPNTTAFFGNGSFVVYSAAGESVACASFRQLAEGEEPGPAFHDFEDEYGGGGGGDDDDDDEEFDEDFDFGDEFRGKFGDGDGGFDGDFDEDFGGDFDFGDE